MVPYRLVEICSFRLCLMRLKQWVRLTQALRPLCLSPFPGLQIRTERIHWAGQSLTAIRADQSLVSVIEGGPDAMHVRLWE